VIDNVPYANRHRGERSNLARLTEDDVRTIRALYADGGVTQAQLGARFGVGQWAISAIVRRATWRHVQ
jgi:DNA-binding transcriptional regulator LsrR (DeoR family)